jgi:integrase
MKYNILSDFREHLNAVLDNKNTADTYYFAVDRLFKPLQFSDLSEISGDTIERLLAQIRTKNRFSACKRGLNHLKAFDGSLNLPDNQFFSQTAASKKNRSVKPTKTLEHDTISRKVNAIRDVKLKTAFRLMEKSGLRVSECAALTKRDISIEGDTVKIDVRHGKGGSNDVVECMEDKWLAGKLQELTESLNEDDKPFYAAQTMKNRAADYGLECHDFRRIAANTFRDERRSDGEELREANSETQNFLRHTRFSVTKRYLANRKLKFKGKQYKNSQGRSSAASSASLGEVAEKISQKHLTNDENRGIIDVGSEKNDMARITEVPASSISKKIADGEYSTKLSRQQHLRHVEGTPEFERYKQERAEKGMPSQAVITISEHETQQLIIDKAGTGIVKLAKKGEITPHESITADKIVGWTWSGDEYFQTNKARIHYGKRSSHIVPIGGKDYD